MLFDPEGPAGGCASGECLPSEPAAKVAAPPSAISPRDDSALPPAERWRRVVESVRQSSPRHGMSLAHGRLRSIGHEEVAIAFPRTAAFHESTVTGSGRAKVEAALSEYLGRPVRLRVDNAIDGLDASLAELEARQRDDREKGVEQSLRNHPAVRATIKILGGELEHIQVLEPERSPALPEEPNS